MTPLAITGLATGGAGALIGGLAGLAKRRRTGPSDAAIRAILAQRTAGFSGELGRMDAARNAAGIHAAQRGTLRTGAAAGTTGGSSRAALLSQFAQGQGDLAMRLHAMQGSEPGGQGAAQFGGALGRMGGAMLGVGSLQEMLQAGAPEGTAPAATPAATAPARTMEDARRGVGEYTDPLANILARWKARRGGL